MPTVHFLRLDISFLFEGPKCSCFILTCYRLNIQILSIQALLTARGKDEIISEPACGTTYQLQIESSFHLYPCKFALFHTLIVMHTIWRRLLQWFMSIMTLWCAMKFSARESPPSLHNRWNHLDKCQNFFFFFWSQFLPFGPINLVNILPCHIHSFITFGLKWHIILFHAGATQKCMSNCNRLFSFFDKQFLLIVDHHDTSFMSLWNQTTLQIFLSVLLSLLF